MNKNETKLMQDAVKLCLALNKGADKLLPQEIVGVVKTHSVVSAGAGLIPIPGVDVAIAAGNIWTMYGRIGSKLGIPFGENLLKSIASGVATNLATYAAASVILKFIPGLGSIAGAALQYAMTLTSGWIYLKALTALANKQGDVHESDVKGAFDEVMKDESAIKDFFNSAKEGAPKK
jgi:uncharacterized protein (DUF697 family)